MTSEQPQRGAWLASLSALLVIAAFLAGKAGRDAILLTHYSITSLPLFVGLSAALSLPVILLAGKLMMRHGPYRLVPAMHATSAVIALVEWMSIDSFPRVTAVVVFFHLNTMGAVLVSGFWSIINERFDIHSAKRHIGRIGMGATLGGILGGVITERVAVYLPHDAILLVLSVMQMSSAVLLVLLARGRATDQPALPGPQTESTRSALRGVAQSSLLRKAGMIVVLTAIGAGALDYVFKADIVRTGAGSDLLRTLALFYTATNIITAVVQVTLCGSAIAALGVPRTVSSLPITLTGFGVLALIFPIPAVTGISRGAELVARNSIYRAGYELLYAPLPPEQKRPTKVALDVGADKLGDILAAQLIGGIVMWATDARTGLLVLAVAAGALSVLVGLRLPKSYTQSLENTLLEKAGEHQADFEPWISLTQMPALGHPGDAVPLQIRRRRRVAPPIEHRDSLEHVFDAIRDLRSRDPQRIVAALAKPLPSEAVPAVIELLGGNDDIARPVTEALRRLAPTCTGMLADAMLDDRRDERVRRRIPALLVDGDPDLATCALWRGMSDPSFQVRYRCGLALARRIGDGQLTLVPPEDVFACVLRELGVGRDEWKSRTLVIDELTAPDESEGDVVLDPGLSHVFRVLGFVLPAEPLRVALRAVKTADEGLRAMALEYLESILPPDVRAQIWPLLDEAASSELRVVDAKTAQARSNELIVRMRESHPGLFVGRSKKTGS